MCRVFVIDDDPGITESLSKILEKSGHKVYQFASVSEAADKVLIIRPSTVILDLSFPGAQGDEFLTPLVTSHCAVIVYTARRLTDEEKVALLRKGVTWIVEKPASVDVIKELVLKADRLANGLRILRRVGGVGKELRESLRKSTMQLAETTMRVAQHAHA